jgi:Flp pilus assembly protein TadG
MLAMAAIPLMGTVGMAVDFTRASAAGTAFQAALDSTALMLSKDAQFLTLGQLQDKAVAYFNAMFIRPEVTNVQVTQEFSSPQQGSFNLKVTSSGTIATVFARVLGHDFIDISATGEVVWGMKRLNLALALDNTGSMSSSGKMTALKEAAHTLLDTLKKAEKTPGDILVSIVPFAVGKIYIGIAEERPEIVERTSEAHSLEVDEKGLSIADHHVLGLEIPVHETAHRRCELFCQGGEFCLEFTLKGGGKLDHAHTLDEVLCKVIPLPPVEIRPKAFRQPQTGRGKVLFWKGMESMCNGKRLFVKGPSSFPGRLSEGPEVRISEVFHKGKTLGRIVADQLGCRNTYIMEECCDVGVEGVFQPLRVIMDQDRRFLRPFQTEESSIRTSPLEG